MSNYKRGSLGLGRGLLSAVYQYGVGTEYSFCTAELPSNIHNGDANSFTKANGTELVLCRVASTLYTFHKL